MDGLYQKAHLKKTEEHEWSDLGKAVGGVTPSAVFLRGEFSHTCAGSLILKSVSIKLLRQCHNIYNGLVVS